MKPPIRVAFCLDSFAIGGTELNAVRTAEALDPERVALSVHYLQETGPLRERYERLGVPMTHVPIPNLYSPRTAVQALGLCARLRRERVDVLHSHDIYCNIFAVPWARIATGCGVIASRRWGLKASRPELSGANRWCSRLAHRVLANSGEVARLVAREGIAAGRIVEIPNFLADEAFATVEAAAREAQRRAWGLPEGAFAVGMLARLAPVKNHALLLDALSQLDGRFHAVLVGEGPARGKLEARAAELGLANRVHFTGEVVSPQVNLHQFFDASVLCSLSEGFPNSIIEAMAAARPVVATPVGGVLDAVEDGVTGFLSPLGDAAALAAALRRLGTDTALRERMGGAGREAARRKYRRAAVIEQLMSLYEALAARAAAAPLRRADA